VSRRFGLRAEPERAPVWKRWVAPALFAGAAAVMTLLWVLS
jgi:hypothetical protein